ncbi:MAG TPA: hypothetical protein VFV38_28035 [Ktedonobacteraceae bacterium]|nr:hypothetical protein [Ktedonobacteraceae bacterium]
MAGKRSIPTSLFNSPDFFELSSDTIRLIMIGLILDADDKGRGHAHPRLLARKLDKCSEDIEQALVELQAHGIVRCYEVAGRAYYVLCHWHTYQTLSKPTPSAYPAPPDMFTAEEHRTPPGEPRETQENPGSSSPEGEEERKEELEELEEKGNKGEEGANPSEVVHLPLPHLDRTSVGGVFSPEKKPVETDQVAFYLQLPQSAELEAVVREFANTSTLSLIGEAIEARSWVNDSRRNRRGHPMTVAFFRRWLRRSRGDYGALEQSHEPTRFHALGTGQQGRQKASILQPAASPQSDDPYLAHFVRRLTEVKAQAQKNLGVVA